MNIVTLVTITVHAVITDLGKHLQNIDLARQKSQQLFPFAYLGK